MTVQAHQKPSEAVDSHLHDLEAMHAAVMDEGCLLRILVSACVPRYSLLQFAACAALKGLVIWVACLSQV